MRTKVQDGGGSKMASGSLWGRAGVIKGPREGSGPMWAMWMGWWGGAVKATGRDKELEGGVFVLLNPKKYPKLRDRLRVWDPWDLPAFKSPSQGTSYKILSDSLAQPVSKAQGVTSFPPPSPSSEVCWEDVVRHVWDDFKAIKCFTCQVLLSRSPWPSGIGVLKVVESLWSEEGRKWQPHPWREGSVLMGTNPCAFYSYAINYRNPEEPW